METLKDFITVADNNILGIKVEIYTVNYLHRRKNGHKAARSEKVRAALGMWGNVGSANSVAVTDASVPVNSVCEVAKLTFVLFHEKSVCRGYFMNDVLSKYSDKQHLKYLKKYEACASQFNLHVIDTVCGVTLI